MPALLVGTAAARAGEFEADFVRIPAGEFEMGCSPDDTACGEEEKPLHRVRITKTFEIGAREATQRQWESVMGSNPSYFKGAALPVEQVSWVDVQEFLARLNARGDGFRYRLPAEAEWEYAARAGARGALYGPLEAIAWYGRNSGDRTHPAGARQANAWGLYDTIGNVWEWCQDWYDAEYYKQFAGREAENPRGPPRGEYRALRGGSWYKYLWFLRASARFGERPNAAYRHVGFRVVRESQ
ncbi:MAG: formylglycine-generating enzyme family protein [Bryobacteraceae bacterium]|nr:formylglycine-generating enzyme family protein [Bryobacteraceae bacterium]